MKSFIIVGMTGTGKTTEAKKLMRKFPKFKKRIFDFQQEYGYPRMSKNEFMAEALKSKGSFILFEEATIFFRTKYTSDDVIELLVSKRHDKNVIVFIFHGLRFIPNDILSLIDYVFIKKTNDNPSYIDKKFQDYPSILRGYYKSMESPDRFITTKVKNIV